MPRSVSDEAYLLGAEYLGQRLFPFFRQSGSSPISPRLYLNPKRQEDIRSSKGGYKGTLTGIPPFTGPYVSLTFPYLRFLTFLKMGRLILSPQDCCHIERVSHTHNGECLFPWSLTPAMVLYADQALKQGDNLRGGQ